MKVIDIYDSGGYRSEADDMLALRLRMISTEMPVGALRRPGKTADSIASAADIDLLTCGFGIGSKLSMPYKVRRLAGGVSPVIIHTHSLAVAEQAALIARAYHGQRPKTIIEFHSGSVEACSSTDRFALEETDAFVFHTEADRDIFMARHPQSVDKMAAVITPGFTVSSLSEPLAAPGEFTLLWSGRIDQSCGLQDAVEAIGSLSPGKNLRMIVAGQGEARSVVPVLKRVKALGISDRVEFIGDAALSSSLMERASALLITSVSAPSSAWQAAMTRAYGMTMIMADCERNRELAGDGTGIFYDPDVHDSDRSLTSLLSRIADGGLTVRNTPSTGIDMHSSVSRLLDLYSSLAASR